MKNRLCKRIFVFLLTLCFFFLPFLANARTMVLEDSAEMTIMSQYVAEKTFFVDTSPGPSKKQLVAVLLVEELASGGKKCSGNVEMKYLVDEGEPYTGTFTISNCGSHKIVTAGRVRYIYSRFFNHADETVKLRLTIKFTWEEK